MASLIVKIGRGKICKGDRGFKDFRGEVPFEIGENVCIMRKSEAELLIREGLFVPDRKYEMGEWEPKFPDNIHASKKDGAKIERYHLDPHLYFHHRDILIRYALIELPEK